MSELFEDYDSNPGTGDNTPEFTVSEISGAIKRVIEGEFGRVRVRGEIGNVKQPKSGHVYLKLKDDRNVIDGIIWRDNARRLAALIEEGLEVVATGRLTTYGPYSTYQVIIEDIQPAGEGALMAMLEKRKKALEAEGLFAPERKKPLPYLPEAIGVVTSPSGAVIRDILHRLRDRFPRKVLIWPVVVQGENCAREVANAISGFNGLPPGGEVPRPDLLIVARGGGSIEDLWGFNEEVVVRAAASSEIPLISAVGHETDTTLIDFAADKRAPTPTAAAEFAVPVLVELLALLDGHKGRLTNAAAQSVRMRDQRLADLSRALPRPEMLTADAAQQMDAWGARLPRALDGVAKSGRLRLANAAGLLRPSMLRRVTGEARMKFSAHGARFRIDEAMRGLARLGDGLEQAYSRLAAAAEGQAAAWRGRLAELERLRRTLGYEATLQRGFAVVRDGARVVTSKADAEEAYALEIQFADGRLELGAEPGRKAAGSRED